jgi:hypothetical protein
VIDADVRVDTREDDDGDGRPNPILDRKIKKDADQLTGEREKNPIKDQEKDSLGQPINSIGSANPRYRQRSPWRRSWR